MKLSLFQEFGWTTRGLSAWMAPNRVSRQGTWLTHRRKIYHDSRYTHFLPNNLKLRHNFCSILSSTRMGRRCSEMDSLLRRLAGHFSYTVLFDAKSMLTNSFSVNLRTFFG